MASPPTFEPAGFSLAERRCMLFDAVMIVKSILITASACLLVNGSLRAALPTMSEQPWMGYFVGFETKKFRFTVDQNAKIMLVPLNQKGEPVSKVTQIPILYGIEETNAEGRSYLRKILPETLESSDAKTSKLEKCTIRGKVTGEAAFEIHITQERGFPEFLSVRQEGRQTGREGV
jgi:hypothetical protein